MSPGRSLALAAALSASVGASPALLAQTHVTVDIGARDATISPDGSRIALSILGKIWTMPIDGGPTTQVTYGPSWDTQPAWSPDGRFLAYASRTGAGSDLIVRTLATGHDRFLHHISATTGHMRFGPVEFGPDGDHVYFVDMIYEHDAHVWRIPSGGGQPEQLTHAQDWHEWSFAVGPAGDRILVESGRYLGTDLYEIDIDDLSAQRLTATPERETSVAWSRDGSRRAHVETYNGVDRIVVTEDGVEPRPVHTSYFDQKQLTFHPDGDWLLVVAGRRLHRVALATGVMTEIPFEARFSVPARPSGDLLITDVRLFDGTGDSVIPSATVLVQGGRVHQVFADQAASGPVVSSDMTVIDGTGRTLLPGLMDNHYHYWTPTAGGSLLASGLTAVRDLASPISDIMDYRDAIRLGLIAGPDIYAAGPVIDGPGGYHPLVDVTVSDPAAAAGLVRALKGQGVDLLKVYFLLEPQVLAAVVAEAEAQELPVTAHVGVRTSWNEAIDAGVDGLEHIRVWRDFLPEHLQPDGRDESLDKNRNPIGRSQKDWTLIDPNGPGITALLDRLADTNTWLDPTLSIQRMRGNERQVFSLAQLEVARQSYDRMAVFVRRAYEAGVPLLAGSDNGGVHNELEAFAKAGIPTAEILRSATVNGARWLGKDEEFGTIEPGKRANLILVDGNPLEDITQLRNVDVVIKDGVVVYQR
ncbi:MAG: amidohydrolase family protein [Longimicrobiales bacterium]